MKKRTVFLGGLLVVLAMGCSGQRPADLGVTNGLLASCPASPNCVSSQSHDKVHYIAPLQVEGDPQQAMARLADIIRHLPRTKIITRNDHYLYATFRSRVWGFVDDVEFYLPPGGNAVQVRSASRLGQGDFGVNRKRIEHLRTLWQAAEKRAATEVK